MDEPVPLRDDLSPRNFRVGELETFTHVICCLADELHAALDRASCRKVLQVIDGTYPLDEDSHLFRELHHIGDERSVATIRLHTQLADW